MKRPYQIAGIVLTLFAGLMIHQSLQLAFYTRLGPGPGFFPLWVSVFLALLGVAMFLQATVAAQPAMPADFIPDRDGAMRLVAMLVALVFLVATMRWLGFRLSMFLFIVFLLRTLGAGRWWTIVLAGLAGSAGIHYAFSSWLRIHLPIGIMGF